MSKSSGKSDLVVLSTPEDRRQKFWRKIDKSGPCWLFTGSLPRNKYAPFSYNYAQTNGHRATLLWVTGHPMPGMFACHRCRNKHCVNPDHLYWGTASENSADRIKDGTNLRPEFHGEKSACASLSNTTVRHIWVDLLENPRDLDTIAKKYKTTVSLVWMIKEKKSWRSITDHMPALPNYNDTSRFPAFDRIARQPLTRAQIGIICQMIDERISLLKIAKHTKCAPETLRHIFFRERGKFPEPCIRRGFVSKRTKGRPAPLYWKQAED